MEEKTTATMRILLPFQGWCVEARGLHEHYKLAEFLKARKRRNSYNNQTCFIFCPQCDNELTGSKSYEFFRICNDGQFEFYKCSKCSKQTRWDFDTFPIPVCSDVYISSPKSNV